jgi:hypothetical protein
MYEKQRFWVVMIALLTMAVLSVCSLLLGQIDGAVIFGAILGIIAFKVAGTIYYND